MQPNPYSYPLPNRATKKQITNWEIVDTKGSFAYVDKTRLRVDEDYQRSRRAEKVKRIAARWSWVACGSLQVALRQDSTLYIIDGGHRWEAAMLREDINDLPCLLFKTKSVEQEAQGFLTIQTNRKAINSVEKFKALLAVGDMDARFVNDLVIASGRTVGFGNGVGNVACVTAMLFLAQNHRKTLEKVWPLILDLSGTSRTIHVDLLMGLEFLQRHLESHGDSLVGSKWATRAMAVGVDELLLSARKAAGLYGRGSTPVHAQGFLTVLNHRMRNPIPPISLSDARTETGRKQSITNATNPPQTE